MIWEGRLLASHCNLVSVFRRLETVIDHRALFMKWGRDHGKRGEKLRLSRS